MSSMIGQILRWGLMIIALTAVIVIGEMTLSNAKVAESISQLDTIITNTQQLYAVQPTFTGLTTAVAVSGNIFPSNMVSGSSVYDKWAGQVQDNVDSTTPTEFDVEFDNVPSTACEKLGSSYTSNNLANLTVNGTVVATINPATLAAACTSSSNTLIWVID